MTPTIYRKEEGKTGNEPLTAACLPSMRRVGYRTPDDYLLRLTRPGVAWLPSSENEFALVVRLACKWPNVNTYRLVIRHEVHTKRSVPTDLCTVAMWIRHFLGRSKPELVVNCSFYFYPNTTFTISTSKHEIKLFSIFVGHLCPPKSISTFRIRIYGPDWQIRIRTTASKSTNANIERILGLLVT